MVIFNSYVGLPEGNGDIMGVFFYPSMTGLVPFFADPNIGRKSGSAKGDSRSYERKQLYS